MVGHMVNHPVDHLVNHLADQMAGHLADHLDAYSLDDSLSYVDTTLNFTNIPLLLFLSLHSQILCWDYHCLVVHKSNHDKFGIFKYE